MTRPLPIAAEHLRIRRAEPADYAGVAAVLAGPMAVAGTLQMPLPSIDRVRERMSKAEGDALVIVAEVRSPDSDADAWEIVGHLGFDVPALSASPRRRHVAAIGMTVRDDWRGRGVGTALLRTALDRADLWTGILRIELTVFTDNEAAIALYRRHGFVVEGTHRAYALRNGVYADAFSMARLHPHPPRLPQP